MGWEEVSRDSVDVHFCVGFVLGFVGLIWSVDSLFVLVLDNDPLLFLAIFCFLRQPAVD